jgi:hypothetical protein
MIGLGQKQGDKRRFVLSHLRRCASEVARSEVERTNTLARPWNALCVGPCGGWCELASPADQQKQTHLIIVQFPLKDWKQR